MLRPSAYNTESARMRVLRLPMRRRIDIEPKSLFQGREFARLMTLFIMLGVIGMLMLRAKDPDTWSFFDRVAEEPKKVDDLTTSPQQSSKPRTPSPASNSSLARLELGSNLQKPEESNLQSLDEDPAEQDSLKEELEAVTDKEDLQAIEMPAYFRLV